MSDTENRKLTFEDVANIAEEIDWSVSIDGAEITFSNYSDAGYDLNVVITAHSPEDVVPELKRWWDGFDPSEEAYLWIDSSGHGKRGAPYELIDIYKDMVGCKEMVADLCYALESFGTDTDETDEEPAISGEWVRVIDRLPENDQEVLVYWREGEDTHQYHLMTYFKKGQEMERIMSRTYNTFAENLLDTIFNDENMVKAPEDGFYFYDPADDIGRFKKNLGVITHWMVLPEPPAKKGGD